MCVWCFLEYKLLNLTDSLKLAVSYHSFPNFCGELGTNQREYNPKSTDCSTFSPLTLLLGFYIYPIFKHTHITLLVMCMVQYIYTHRGVSINGGNYPNSWMVYSMEIPIL